MNPRKKVSHPVAHALFWALLILAAAAIFRAAPGLAGAERFLPILLVGGWLVSAGRLRGQRRLDCPSRTTTTAVH